MSWWGGGLVGGGDFKTRSSSALNIKHDQVLLHMIVSFFEGARFGLFKQRQTSRTTALFFFWGGVPHFDTYQYG